MKRRLLTHKRRSLDISKTIREAARVHQQGKLNDAERLYQAVLKVQPDHFDALHLLGVLRARQGKLDEAVRLMSLALQQNTRSAEAHANIGIAQARLRRYHDAIKSLDLALAINPKHAEALSNRGNALRALNRHEEAIASYDQALAIKPDSADVLYNRGTALQALNRNEEALASYDKALEIRPDHAGALTNRGTALLKLNRHEEALASYDKALTLKPGHADVLSNRGSALIKLSRYEEALTSCDRALVIKPDHADALNNRGTALQALKRHEEAIASYDQALGNKPERADVLNNRGNALIKLNRHEEALASYDKALAIKPDYADALNNRGAALQALSRHEEALASYDKALAIKADNANALNNRGTALEALKRHEEALASYDQALAIKPDHVDALTNRGNALQMLNRREEALASYEQALALKADCKYILGDAVYCRAHICDWKNRNLLERQLVDDVRAGKPVSTPFAFLTKSDNPADQLTCAASFVRNKFPAAPSSLGKRVSYQHDRIRVAYLSADFHEHATAYLVAGLFEQHDRAKFETIGISFGRDTQSETRSRLTGSFDRFVDVRVKRDEEVVALLRESEVDIAVDLKGFTRDARTGILAHRPAPIQVNYLGYPGTMGADYIDYILVDRMVIPEEHHPYYTEKVVYLPDCYQVNDAKRRIAEHTPSRAEVGLPERGFVFCSFNNCYKITPAVFDVWMRLLRQVEGSVLWLLEANAAAARNLRREAQARGVAPERLVFAPRVKLANHLARHRLADLFLDTLPINAHTTASDALWAGLPLLTCLGTTFAGRGAASLLNAIGLPELITHSMEEYEALARKLASEPPLLQEIKDKLAQNRLTAPLFDTDRFRRHIEAAFTTMCEIYQRGEQPRSFEVMPVAPESSTPRPLTISSSPPQGQQTLHITQTIQQALGLRQQGKLQEAEPLCLAILKARPDHFDALHLLGVLRAQLGSPHEAVKLISRALERRPGSAEAHTNLGVALAKLDCYEEALASYDKALAIKPDYADALNNRGVALQALKRHEEALASYDKALAIKPSYADALNNRGNALQALSRHEEAIASYDKALAIKPDHANALNNHGNALLALNRYEEALASYDKALAIKPDYTDALSNRGAALTKLNRHQEAVASCDKALAIKPDHADALSNRGAALKNLNRYEEALASYDEALAIKPDHADALSNRGAALTKLNRHQEAIASYDKALAIKPEHADALNNRGNAMIKLNRHEEALASYDKALAIKPNDANALNNRGTALTNLNRHREAIASYDKALAIKPDHADALNNRGIVLEVLGRYEEAIASYDKALATNADFNYTFGHAAHCRALICDWKNRDLIEKRLVDDARSGKPVTTPFSFLGVSHRPADQFTCTTNYVHDKYPTIVPPVWKRVRYKHDRIRLAYLSADFRVHPSSFLLAGMFEHHDRSRFETIAISFGDDDQSEIRARLMGAFEHFVDVRSRDDLEVARLMCEREVDIAVDLMGHTRHNRMGILAMRPAPVQVNFFCPGTSGADYLDYIVCDRVVIPEDHHVHYSEKVVYLPDTFQANDSKRRIAERTPSRTEMGLPDKGFVFCSFNNTYKFTPGMFDIWMRLLGRVDGSVLWLQQVNATAAKNLQREAIQRGIDANRLVFARRVPRLEDHLARYRLADLFLDTLPYNAQTTASDALWAGLPIITCLGTTFVGRVAASLLNAIGLPELIAHSLPEYETLALELATHSAQLADFRVRLARNRATCPLFDTDRFRRHIEAAYTTMWEIQQRGEEPRSFAAPPGG